MTSSVRVPDTTLYDFVERFGETEVAGLRRQLQAQVRSEWRSKTLAPVGLPWGSSSRQQNGMDRPRGGSAGWGAGGAAERPAGLRAGAGSTVGAHLCSQQTSP